MAVHMDRRELLKSLGWGSLAACAAGAAETVMPAWAEAAAAQGTPPRAGIPRITFSRASLANGIIPHSGETSMELYHNHPHFEKEEIVQPEDIRLQTRLTMRNHKEILDWMGLDWKHVVKVTRFQKRLDESKAIEAVMADYFRDTWPPMSVYEIEGLSSPQARVEIEMWVVPPSAEAQKYATPAPVKGLFSVLPRPEVVARTGYAPGILVSKDMDLVFMSALTAWPFNVDPWNPGSFKLPADTAAQEKMLADNVERTLKAAGLTWQHIVVLDRTGEGAAFSSMTERMGSWRPCRTTRVVSSGVPGAKVLCDMTAVAERRT